MNAFEHAFLTKLAQGLAARLLRSPKYVKSQALKRITSGAPVLKQTYDASVKAGKIPSTLLTRSKKSVVKDLYKMKNMAKQRTLSSLMAARQ